MHLRAQEPNLRTEGQGVRVVTVIRASAADAGSAGPGGSVTVLSRRQRCSLTNARAPRRAAPCRRRNDFAWLPDARQPAVVRIPAPRRVGAHDASGRGRALGQGGERSCFSGIYPTHRSFLPLLRSCTLQMSAGLSRSLDVRPVAKVFTFGDTGANCNAATHSALRLGDWLFELQCQLRQFAVERAIAD